MPDPDNHTLSGEIKAFNEKFDYGFYHHNSHFWLKMLRHQVDEIEQALDEGDESHAVHEAADTVLVASQMMDAIGRRTPEYYLRARMQNAESKGIENIIERYKTWYEVEHQ